MAITQTTWRRNIKTGEITQHTRQELVDIIPGYEERATLGEYLAYQKSKIAKRKFKRVSKG